MNKLAVGDKIVILEQAYCGIDKARVGDTATIISFGPNKACFWVAFDMFLAQHMILVEHNGSGWKKIDYLRGVA